MDPRLEKLQSLLDEGWLTDHHINSWLESIRPMVQAQEVTLQSGERFRLVRMSENSNRFVRTNEVIGYIARWGEKVRNATPEQMKNLLAEHPDETKKEIVALGETIKEENGDVGYLFHSSIRGFYLNLESGPSVQGRMRDDAGVWPGYTYVLVEVLS